MQRLARTRGPVRDIDYVTSVREPGPGTDFLPPDVNRTAVIPHDRDLIELLEEIESNTRKPISEGVIWQQRSQRLPAGAGELTVQATDEVRHIYIPNVPREMTVYAGQSSGLFLGTLTIGQTLQVELPYFTNGVFIVYAAGVADQHVNVYFSSKSIDISVR